MSAEREKIKRLEKKVDLQQPRSIEVILSPTLADYEAQCETHKEAGPLAIIIIIKSF